MAAAPFLKAADADVRSVMHTVVSKPSRFKAAAVPASAANYELNDVVENTSLSVDVNGMVLREWVCIDNGGTNTWYEQHLHTATHA